MIDLRGKRGMQEERPDPSEHLFEED